MRHERQKLPVCKSAKDAAKTDFLPMGYAYQAGFMKIPSAESYFLQIRAIAAVMACSLCLFCAGCPRQDSGSAGLNAHLLRKIDISSPSRIEASDDAVNLGAARNEWTDFVVQADSPAGTAVRLSAFKINGTLGNVDVSAYQVLSVPVDLNNAEYVRHSGDDGETRSIPRALLPLTIHDGIVDLPKRNGEPIRIWFDLHVPGVAAAGNYQATCELLDSSKQAIASVPVTLAVADFVLPDAPSVQMVGVIDWEELARLYPAEFETIMPRLLNRSDSKFGPAVRVLDQLIGLAHENHVEVVVPRLQPTVKWSPGQIDWSDFDPLVGPWLSGTAFRDRAPMGYWPMPAPDFIDNFDPQSRSQYWHGAAEHFEKAGWLGRCPAVLHRESPGAVTAADGLILSAEARQVLGAHPELCVRVPLRDDELMLASVDNPNLADPATTARLLTESPGLVWTAATQAWPEKVERPGHWLEAGGCVDANDVRTWAALAFVRGASIVSWQNPLPASASIQQPASSDQLIWFYPGEWFGVDRPVETVQLKWLRQAQQDFEYFALARKSGGEIAGRMAELIAKPVELAAGAENDPTFSLLCGMSDPHAWAEARQLLSDRIAKKLDDKQELLEMRTLRWVVEQERPTVLARGVHWSWDNSPDAGGHRLNAKIDVDVFNPSNAAAEGNELAWSGLQSGWEVRPQPIVLDALGSGQVRRVTAEARFDLNQISPESGKPLELTVLGGAVGQTIACQFVAPVAVSQRLRGEPSIDGSLDDWSAADAIQLDRPLVRMLNRPAIERQEFQSADLPASVYSGWADDGFFLAFRLAGLVIDKITSCLHVHRINIPQAKREEKIVIGPAAVDRCRKLGRLKFLPRQCRTVEHFDQRPIELDCISRAPIIERPIDDRIMAQSLAGGHRRCELAGDRLSHGSADQRQFQWLCRFRRCLIQIVSSFRSHTLHRTRRKFFHFNRLRPNFPSALQARPCELIPLGRRAGRIVEIDINGNIQPMATRVRAVIPRPFDPARQHRRPLLLREPSWRSQIQRRFIRQPAGDVIGQQLPPLNPRARIAHSTE